MHILLGREVRLTREQFAISETWLTGVAAWAYPEKLCKALRRAAAANDFAFEITSFQKYTQIESQEEQISGSGGV